MLLKDSHFFLIVRPIIYILWGVKILRNQSDYENKRGVNFKHNSRFVWLPSVYIKRKNDMVPRRELYKAYR